MIFSSLLFMFIYLPIVFGIYFIMPRGKKNVYKNAFLFFVSLIFYAWGEPVYIILMMFTTFFDWISGIYIHKFMEKNQKNIAKTILIVASIVNLSFLGYFKYSNFLIDNINGIFNLDIPFKEIALPIGISFYTFQAMSYMIDVYRKMTDVQKNFLSFGAYVALFPQLIAGPIVQYKTIAEQLDNRKETISEFVHGIKIFTIGLAKKVLLANNIGLLWDTVKIMPDAEKSVLGVWLGIIAFSFQIYFDFSGYSDMAIGLGHMLGFKFDLNFNYPYISRSATEFWRRWHISLGVWFKEYVYIPLGGNRVKKWRALLNIMIVWFLTGFWHGAEWAFIIWGLYFGVILILEKTFLLKFLEKLPKFVSHIYLLLIVVISWVFFSLEDLGKATKYIGEMFGLGKLPLVNDQSIYMLYTNIIMMIILALSCTMIFKKIKDKLKEKNSKVFDILSIAGCVAVWTVSTIYLVSASYNPFLYFRF